MKNLNDIIDSEGEIRIGRNRHLDSMGQVYIDGELVAESEPGLATVGDILSDLEQKAGEYIKDNW